MNTSSDEVTNCLLHRLISKAITTDTHKYKRPLTLVWGMAMEHRTKLSGQTQAFILQFPQSKSGVLSQEEKHQLDNLQTQAELALATQTVLEDEENPYEKRSLFRCVSSRVLKTVGSPWCTRTMRPRSYNEAKIIRDEVRRDCDRADGARIFRHNDDDLSHVLPALLDWYQASLEVQDPAE